MIRPANIRRLGAAVLAALVLTACTGDGPSAPGLVDPKQLLWAVVLDHHAISLTTTGDQSSIQIQATAVNADGGPLSGATVVFSLSDSERVAVDANGRVTARAAATDVQLVATARLGNVTRTDTADIDIVDASPAPVLTTFALSLASGGQTVPSGDLFGFFGTDQAIVTATDDAGASIDGLPVYYTSSDPTTLSVEHSTGVVHGIRPGTAVLTATTTAFGVTKVDSVKITVGGPQFAVVLATPLTPVGSTKQVLVFEPADLTVSVGASVMFANPSATMPIDVVFDDSTDVTESPLYPTGSGNVSAFDSDTTNGSVGLRLRAFPKAGTYTYHSTLFETNGRIIVQ